LTSFEKHSKKIEGLEISAEIEKIQIELAAVLDRSK
jgi:hypothetical protein